MVIGKVRKCGLRVHTVRQTESWLNGRSQRVMIKAQSLAGGLSLLESSSAERGLGVMVAAPEPAVCSWGQRKWYLGGH